jgi:hypothetical protein
MEADSEQPRYLSWADKMSTWASSVMCHCLCELTYKVEEVLDSQWSSVACSFGNCFAPTRISWWMNLKLGPRGQFHPPFTSLKSLLEAMSWSECEMESPFKASLLLSAYPGTPIS